MAFGGPDVLEPVELPDPVPGPGQMTIDVSHAAVGLVDLLFRRGQFRDVPGMAQPPFIPGLEVAGRVRALGEGVTGFALGEAVVSMSAGAGTGGYASVYLTRPGSVVSIEGSGLDPAHAVAALPNAAMAHVALTEIAHLLPGESVLVHGALGGLAAAFPGMAKQLGASKVVGTVRASKREAAGAARLPYDRIIDSALLSGELAAEKFDIIIDPVGGVLRSQSLAFMRPGSRLIVVGNASGDWTHQIGSNDLWLGNISVSGFNAGAYLASRQHLIGPALDAALKAAKSGLLDMDVDVLPFSEAVTAHQRMESRTLRGRIVLTP
jgi:NADPH2:quinone reductase